MCLEDCRFCVQQMAFPYGKRSCRRIYDIAAMTSLTHVIMPVTWEWKGLTTWVVNYILCAHSI